MAESLYALMDVVLLKKGVCTMYVLVGLPLPFCHVLITWFYLISRVFTVLSFFSLPLPSFPKPSSYNLLLCHEIGKLVSYTIHAIVSCFLHQNSSCFEKNVCPLMDFFITLMKLEKKICCLLPLPPQKTWLTALHIDIQYLDILAVWFFWICLFASSNYV